MRSAMVVRPGNLREKDPEKRGKLQVMDVAAMPVGEHDVKIKIAYCAICGSDPHIVENIFGRTVPYGLGHEISGIVVELGEKATVKGLKVGDKVAGNFLRACGACYYCQNGQPQFCTNVVDEGVSPGMSQYVVWDESQVVKIPDEIPLKKACLLEPVSIGVRVSDRTELKAGQRVAIQGGGPIGLICAQMMKLKGATDLTVIEPIASRREIALRLGADHVIDPFSCDVEKECMKLTGGHGYDVIIEGTGVPAIASIPLKIAAPDGRILYIAMYNNDFAQPIPMTDTFHNRNLTLTATKVAPYCFPRAAQLLPRMNLDEFTPIVFPLEQISEAFDAYCSNQYLKVLICCNDDLANL